MIKEKEKDGKEGKEEKDNKRGEKSYTNFLYK